MRNYKKKKGIISQPDFNALKTLKNDWRNSVVSLCSIDTDSKNATFDIIGSVISHLPSNSLFR